MSSAFRRFALVLPAFALFASQVTEPILARPAKPAAARPAAKPVNPLTDPSRPWLYQNSDVEMDPAWTFGTLPNGVRYGIRRNGVPPGQVSIRVRMDVGSLMEREDELGFAHYMEHLTFRGSKYVPDGEAKRVWQRLGATFGSDSNAETTPTGTTYALDLPQASPQGLDESMKILSGMISSPNINAQSVEAERAVVLAEMRESYGPRSRLADATRELLFAGQPMATRPPIGTPKTLGAANAEALQAFHDRWYRPERAVIAISGDADPKVLEQLVIKHFSAWKPEGAAAAIPDFGRPDPKLPATKVLVDPGVPANLTLAFLREWKPRADTVVYNQGKLTDQLALQIINRRLEQAARAGGSFIQASVDQQDVSRSIDGTFIQLVPSGDWQKALMDVRAIVEDAKTTPPTQAEIDREYAQLDTLLAIQVENQDTEAMSRQAENLTAAVDIRETTVSPQVALDIYRGGKPNMTPAVILASTKRLFTGEATRSILTLPATEPEAELKLAAALAQPVDPAKDVRIVARDVSLDKLPSLGTPGTEVNTVPTGLPTMETITFSNGVKLILFPNKAEDQKVRVTVRFGNGRQSFSPTKPVASWAAGYALIASGIADFDQRDLDDLTNGRRIGMDFAIDDDAFEMNAVTRPADFRDQLRLMASKLAFPRWDPAPIARLKAGLLSTYDAFDNSAQGLLGRDLDWRIHDQDVRYRTPTKEEITALTPEAFRATWEPVLKQGPIEILVFGDTDRATAVKYVGETFGAMAPRGAVAPPKENSRIRFPKHNSKPVTLYHEGSDDQAAAVIAWPTSGGFDGMKEARQLEILTQIINDRLFEKLRSTDGAAYSPNVSNAWPFAYPGSGGYIQVLSQIKPDKIDYFYTFVDGIVKDLQTNPVPQDELDRTIAPMRQLLNRAATGNAFWMQQMEGSTRDPRYLMAMRTMASDMLNVTSADLQNLAKKYLVPGKSWSLVVLPKAKPAGAGAPASR